MGRTRLAITGALCSSTPFEVIEQVCLCHQIPIDLDSLDETDLDRLVSTINNTPVEVDDETFVNPEVEWTPEFLRLALEHLDQWTQHRQIPETLEIGWISPENIQTLDPCILYRLCQLHQIQTTRDTNSDQMKIALESYKFQTRQSLIQQLQSKMEGMSLCQLASMVTLCVPLEPYSLQNVVKASINYDQNTVPKTHEQAVIAAGFQHQVDISSSRFPLEEYRVLNLRKKRDFTPVDPTFKRLYRSQPRIYDLSQSFNPNLPKKCYDGKSLRMMVLNQGFTAAEIASHGSYELIRKSLEEDNFYRFNPTITLANQSTAVLQEPIQVEKNQVIIDDQPHPFDDLICYGVYGEPMIAFTVSELIHTFTICGQFSNPSKANEIFPIRTIKKLSGWFRYSSKQDESNLCQIIDEIQQRLTKIDAQTQRVKTQYNRFTTDEQHQFDIALVKLLEMGMYMRSWKGKGTYPMSSIETQYDPDDPSHFKRISEALSQFRVSIETDGGKLLYWAPLIDYRNRSFRVNIYDGSAQTIRDRYLVVNKNDMLDERACMRSSSNYFCWSAFFYMRLLGKSTPFDIDMMREIN